MLLFLFKQLRMHMMTWITYVTIGLGFLGPLSVAGKAPMSGTIRCKIDFTLTLEESKVQRVQVKHTPAKTSPSNLSSTDGPVKYVPSHELHRYIGKRWPEPPIWDGDSFRSPYSPFNELDADGNEIDPWEYGPDDFIGGID
jgi:hypothetical protein